MKSASPATRMVPVKYEMAAPEDAQEQLANDPRIEEIRQRAYEIYLERGCADGKDFDDWLQAERELVERIRNRHSGSL